MPVVLNKALHDRPVTDLKNVGDKLAEKLHKLGIYTVQDVLFHLPLRYQDRTRITPIGALRPGLDAVIEGEIRAADVVFGKRRSLVVRLQDGTGTISLRFYHFSTAQKNNLSKGTLLRCYGEARRGVSGLELYHPEYQRLDEANPNPVEARLTPIYPSTEGLNQARWQQLTQQAIGMMAGDESLQDWLPPQVLAQLKLPPLNAALRYLHAPDAHANLEQLAEARHPCQVRLILEELLAHHLSLLQLRMEIQQDGAIPVNNPGKLRAQLLANLPFSPTNAQSRVEAELRADMARSVPMLRLVQGDVGSGKTLVAALAAVAAIESGQQVALMAPTEILAEQHLHNFSQWLNPLGIEVSWLAGKLKGKARSASLSAIAGGQAQMVVGTHALFQEEVEFANLGLVIIDEQHRFGVHQRLALKEKGKLGVPHQLIMTATPIPRTLAMSAYADLDTSVIDELPPGRTPVKTLVVSDERRDEVVERIQLACAHGAQAYWVCTLIEESETLEAQAAENTLLDLQAMLPGMAIGLVHGRMKAAEKSAVMDAFKRNELQLLVATTVIEVGVDVPNASLMVIENPERLGLAQLHQLRGRVGRGSAESHCVLLYHRPLSQQGKTRLQVMRETNDGFRIAEEDLTLRGPGEVLGTRQTGLMQFRVADLQRDAWLLDTVKPLAQNIIRNNAATQALISRWIGDKTRYAQV